MITVSVIIPYYQRRAGILRRTLQSIIDQKNIPINVQLDVIIIDDGSPISAASEVINFQLKSPHHFRVILQENSGVSAARNKALSLVDDDTKYIAFLDSDDIWQPEHISLAMDALNQGADYYFTNGRRINEEVTSFEKSEFSSYLSNFDVIPVGSDFFKIEKDAFFNFSLHSWVSRIPTVVYRYSLCPALRFDESLRAASEDCLFLLQIIKMSNYIIFSSRTMVVFADGINLYYSLGGWDDENFMIATLNELTAFCLYREKLMLSSKNDAFLRKKIREQKLFFAFLTFRSLMKTRKPWSSNLLDTMRKSPSFWLWYPFYLCYIAISFPLGLYKP